MSEHDRAAKLKASISESYGKIDTEEQREFINNLLEVIEVPVKKIPEPVFKEIFWPYFTGERKADANSPAISHWIGLVGSASAEAEVVDIKGNVLFKVPPMYDSDRLDTLTQTKGTSNFAAIFENAVGQARVHPSMGQKYLAEELSKKLLDRLPENPNGHSWRPVFEHYGLIKKAEAVAANTAAKQNDDDLEWDD